jgi:hypothetical protein
MMECQLAMALAESKELTAAAEACKDDSDEVNLEGRYPVGGNLNAAAAAALMLFFGRTSVLPPYTHRS